MFSGHVEVIERGSIRGWVVDADDPQRRLKVELVVDGWPVMQAAVDIARPDLDALRLGRNDLAFNLKLPREIALDVARLQVRVAGERVVVAMSDRACGVEGVLEHVAQDVLTGWAWHIGFPRERVRLDVRIGGRVVANGIAEHFRPDLLEAGIGDGYYAFRVPVALDASQIGPGLVEVVERRTGRIIRDLRLPSAPPPPPRAVAPPRQAQPAAPSPKPEVAPQPQAQPQPQRLPTPQPAVAEPAGRIRVEQEQGTITLSREAAEALAQAMGLDDDAVL